MSRSDGRLLLGPLLRYVDETSASVWVETDAPGTVSVVRGAATASAPTFLVHGHHYALVELDGLEPGTTEAYTVAVDGEQAWPPAGSPFPDPVIATLEAGRPLHLAFGSCRTSVAHDAKGNRSHGVDALRAWALRVGGQVEPADPDDPDLTPDRLPDLVLFLGDQVYADDTTDAMREFIESRRDIDEPPWTELQDYEEYAHLYRLAWSDPANRWLLSTVPSAMIFDDHDIRDDWNTSLEWRREMEATSWWHGRIVAGLGSYWVHQHLGNLAPADREVDEVYGLVRAHRGQDEQDLGPLLDAFAARVDQQPETYRWSFAREYDTQARLVVVDSRAARRLDPDHRAMLDPSEAAWLDEQLRGDVDHLLIGTSLPFLLARGLHHLEAFSEALARGAWGERAGRLGEKARQLVDLEHWGAFQTSFQEVARQVMEVAAGKRGRAPSTVTFLSGDVHHSYVSQARPVHGGPELGSTILQAVCSPMRNPLARGLRLATAVLSYGVAGPAGRLAARSARVPDTPFTWTYAEGPWFDNNLAFLDLAGPSLRMWWVTGEVVGDHERPRLAKVESYALDEDGNPPPLEGVASRVRRRIARRANGDLVRER
ncbi:alkaline phosphatase D family protein [Nocardioides sp. zg-1228]|uniref:alkaline phosphatase D family protein n=1 Tax=Nocardioides sp. zg-1228 TaxID=2763008 RepID=UPI00164319E5|nr:alkaline phosphatase D family protein [Nocardioides sp. zg-1228]MBC2934622.1 alkaline phosphatase family protein [Nocardioides sp. zg-1228]QSF59369.1 alkaline phosphatase family protein [Nocardioides sp. zg-1228]